MPLNQLESFRVLACLFVLASQYFPRVGRQPGVRASGPEASLAALAVV